VRLRIACVSILLLLLLSLGLSSQSAKAQTPVVRAVLFYSHTCPHCHTVITEVLPPLVEQYGQQLEIIGIDVSTEAGQALYQGTINRFQIPDNRIGVPTLVVGESVLVGSGEIPNFLPSIIAEGLNNGGIDWPDIPGLQQALVASGYKSAEDAKQDPPEDDISDDPSPQISLENPTVADKFALDPLGNSISVLVLFGMFVSVVGVGYSFLTDSQNRYLHWSSWSIPILSAIGLFVALYLSYVEVTGSEAVCGPVGNCNSVQESRYAYLFGVIPIGAMGVAGYIAIMIAWAIQQYGPKSLRKFSTLAIWGMSWFGVLFSIYLTFLEPFVIGATCMWCITSAITMTLILWASTKQALDAIRSSDIDFEDNPHGVEDDHQDNDK
jgi:uncharacterized membrane protein/thiol-disulfide isomerase/thioredoxin